MSDFPQNDNNVFSMLKSNYTCISEEQARKLAKMITQNNEVQSSLSKYSGTSFDLYTSDSFIQTAKTTKNPNTAKKKQSELDNIIDEDSLPIKMEKSIFDKFADWLSGFEIQDDDSQLTLKDIGFDTREVSFE